MPRKRYVPTMVGPKRWAHCSARNRTPHNNCANNIGISYLTQIGKSISPSLSVNFLFSP